MSYGYPGGQQGGPGPQGAPGYSYEPPDPEKKHPYRYFWLTGGLATIIAAVIGVSVTTSSSNSGGGGNNNANVTGNSSAVPASYQGTWSGSIAFTTMGITAGFNLLLDPGQVGQQVGNWENTTAGCSGPAILESSSIPLTLRLNTTLNPTGECVPQSDVEVTLQGTTLTIVATGDFGSAPGSGVLGRQG